MSVGFAFFAVSCTSTRAQTRIPETVAVADADPFSAGSIKITLDGPLGIGVRTADAEAIFYPRLNAVALEFRHDLVTYRIFWDPLARQHFTAAMELYDADYNSRKLVNRYRNTRDVYGKVAGRLEWQTMRFTANHISSPEIELGYRFREVDVNGEKRNSAFLTASASFPSDSDSDKPGSGPEPESSTSGARSRISIYFTRAAAEDLAVIFDQSYLMGLLGEAGIPKTENDVPHDDYDEYGSGDGE